MRRFFQSRPALAWAFYDWANSAFATTVMAGFFPQFFRAFWSQGADPTVTTLRLGFANAAAGLIVAVLAPVLGAIADQGGARVRFLAAWTLIGVFATAGFFLVEQGQWVLAAALFVVGTMGFNGGVVFCDALLLDVARPSEYDRVSALGYALGYLGGGLLFAINVLMVSKPAWFGLSGVADAVRWSFLSVALWWLVFSLPLVLYVRERPPPVGATARSLAAGLAEIAATMRHARALRPLFAFLIAYWLYIDAVNTIIKMAVDYGMALGLDSTKLLTALLLTQFVAFPAAIVFGRIGERIGARNAILIGLAVYLGVTVWGFFLDSTADFFAMAVVVGLVQGGVQSLSRSLFGRFVPAGKSAEFFGLYNMVGKFGTVLGPPLMGVTAWATGSSRASILAVALLFIAGAWLLFRIREPQPSPG